MRYKKPSWLHYRMAQVVCWLFAKVIFRRKVLRNEIKGVTGPYVVIANHQAAYDFASLLSLNWRPMSFVISNSFYNSLPISGFLNKLGVIPKQQFQTTVADMKNMKAVVDAGQPLVIYPAGLMCEDGLSTPMPTATYKFLKWLGVDIYVARISGSYFAMPKWSAGFRPGRTCLDVYKLISAEELAHMDIDTIRDKTDQALLYDAYREQEQMKVKYRHGHEIQGLENVLYVCPHCGGEHTIHVRGKSTLYCRVCGFEQTADEYGFLHNAKGIGPEIRYVSDWSRMIYERLAKQVREGTASELSCNAKIQMIDYEKHQFLQVGQCTVTLNRDQFRIVGSMNGEETELEISIAGLPTLPFGPGKYFEIQDGKNIYRCVPDDGRLVMKFINLVKIFYKLSHPDKVKTAG